MDSNPSSGKMKNNQENIGDLNPRHMDTNPQAQNALNAGRND